MMTIDEPTAALPPHGWTLREDGKAIMRTFRFPDFAACFSYMTAVAFVAEKMDHHPDWLNSYNRLEVTLTSHDKGAVTSRDILMAVEMNRLFEGSI